MSAKPRKLSAAQAAGWLAIEALVGVLIGPRICAKEIVTRAMALAICRRHYRIHGRTVRELAAKIGVSKRALSRRVRALPAELRASGELARVKRQSVPRARRKARRKVPTPP